MAEGIPKLVEKQNSNDQSTNYHYSIPSPIVLSIQSHMVHGRSGNRSAILPLEVNGIDVDPFNTVNFSAHTAYPNHRGTIMTVEQFCDIVEGLKLDKIADTYTHLLTGYIYEPNLIRAIAEFKRSLPNVHYFCDPVLGDYKGLYVKKECIDVFKTELIPLAETIIPNAFEAMWLANLPMNNQVQLLQVVEALHKLGPKNVVISSTEWKRRFIFFSFENGKTQYAIETPSISHNFDGPGDVFAALLLANMIKYPNDYSLIAERTVNSVFSILKKTYELNYREIALVQCIQDLMNPQIQYKTIEMDEFMKIDISSPNPKF